MSRKKETYGLSCCIRNCRATFDISTTSRSLRQKSEFLHEQAGKAGWVLGLNYEGQAEYACPDHADHLIDASPLRAFCTISSKFKATIVTKTDTSA